METPLITQEEVYSLIRSGLEKGISEAIGKSYNNPIEKIVIDAIKVHEDEIRQLVYSMIGSTIKDKDFIQILKQELKHKVAKNLVAKLEGGIEKSVNDYRNDPIIRAKMIVAIEELIATAPSQ